MAWPMEQAGLPFGRPVPVWLDGIEMPSTPAFFRHYETTHELVFSGQKDAESQPSLWIIKGFRLMDGR